MSNARLMWVTPQAEFMMAYIARGSNPPNQSNPEFEKLFRYCLKHKHWSPFQMASMCVEIQTSLAIAAQVKRHWSLAICEPADIQETSMRYMDPFEHGWSFQEIELRYQAESNRQSSEKPLQGWDLEIANAEVHSFLEHVKHVNQRLKNLGVANEQLRMFYPVLTDTRFYIAGSCRSWIHYFEQRLSEHAQLEHQVLALQLWGLFETNFPTVAKIKPLREQVSAEAEQRYKGWASDVYNQQLWRK